MRRMQITGMERQVIAENGQFRFEVFEQWLRNSDRDLGIFEVLAGRYGPSERYWEE